VQAVSPTEAASREPFDTEGFVRARQEGNPVRNAITIRPESKTLESAFALLQLRTTVQPTWGIRGSSMAGSQSEKGISLA